MPELDADALDALDDITTTDARILDCLADGRNAPANIADEIGRHPKHVSERLSHLREQGLANHVGRESISLHEITEQGRRIHDAYVEFQSALQSA